MPRNKTRKSKKNGKSKHPMEPNLHFSVLNKFGLPWRGDEGEMSNCPLYLSSTIETLNMLNPLSN